MQANLNPYISFNGKTREAMEFYQSIFGGELSVSTFADQHVPDAPADGVMHAQLSVDGKPVVMGSDGMDDAGLSGFSLSLSGTNAEELRGYFQKLAEGGEVTKPLAKESWGDEFGMLRDKFGINWMVNIAAPQAS
jgi:PhnB protein